MKLTDILSKKTIVPSLKASDRKGVIQELVQAVRKSHTSERFNVSDVVETILGREKVGSTGLGGGVALPHAKLDGLKGIYGAFGRSVRGVDFNAVDGESVSIIFLILSPQTKPELHVQAVQRTVSIIRQPNICKFLKNAKTVRDIEEILREAEEPATV